MSERPDMVHDGKSEQGRSGHRSHDTAEDHSGGGGGHHAHMVADLRRRFWVSVILSIPVLALAPPIQAWLGLSETLAFLGDRSVQAVFATITYLYGGWPFLRGVASELARDVAEVLLELLDHESASQFSREFKRLFGNRPMEESKRIRKSRAEPTESTPTSSTLVWQAMAWYLDIVRTAKLSRRSGIAI